MNIICHPEMNHTARENTHKESQASLTTLNVKVIEKCLILLQKLHTMKTHKVTRSSKYVIP